MLLFRPTLILCPSAVVEVWFSEARKYFPALRSYRWFEAAEKQRSAHIRDATLPVHIDELHAWLQLSCPPDQPRSAATIIISSYETFCSRALTVTASKSSEGTCADYSLRPPASLLFHVLVLSG